MTGPADSPNESVWGVERKSPPTIRARQANRVYLWTKRMIDLVVSSLALLFLAPLVAVIAMLIKMDSPGPVIFSQERAGYDWRRRKHRVFRVHKFRSMAHNCDQTVHEQHVRDWIRGHKGGTATKDPEQLVKLANDRRITRVGHILRKTSLDELPQLWNVLIGEMSMVGPRPVPLYEIAEYEPWHRKRLDVTPGITCLWQVRGRGQTSLDEMVRMDLEYIQHRSLWLDVKILLKTVPVVLSGRGAA